MGENQTTGEREMRGWQGQPVSPKFPIDVESEGLDHHVTVQWEWRNMELGAIMPPGAGLTISLTQMEECPAGPGFAQSAKSLRLALLCALAELERLSGCVDPDCELDGCWLADLSDGATQHVDDAMRFLNDPGGG